MAFPTNPPATTTPAALKSWAQAVVDTVTDHESRLDGIDTDFSGKADVADPTFTGEPIAPSWRATGKSGATATPIRVAGGTATGAPTTGAHLKGEVIFDDTGRAFYCTTAGTPGTWIQVGPSSVLQGWFQDNVAASQTNVALVIANARTEVPMPAAGSVVGVALFSNAARSAGTATVEPTIDGTKIGLAAVLDGTNTTVHTARQARGVDAFTAGQRIGVKLTTDGSWAPTTADIDVAVLIAINEP